MLLLWVLPASILGCNTLQRGACESLAKEICDTCDVEGFDKGMCECIEDGEFSSSDVDDYFGGDEDAAELACWRAQEDVKNTYQTHESVASCREESAFIKEYEGDACVALGYEEEGGGGTTPYSYDTGR